MAGSDKNNPVIHLVSLLYISFEYNCFFIFEKSGLYHRRKSGFNLWKDPIFKLSTFSPLTEKTAIHFFVVLAGDLASVLNPFTPRSDQYINYPYNFKTLSSRQVMRMNKIITWGIWSPYNTKFSGLAYKETYGIS